MNQLLIGVVLVWIMGVGNVEAWTKTSARQFLEVLNRGRVSALMHYMHYEEEENTKTVMKERGYIQGIAGTLSVPAPLFFIDEIEGRLELAKGGMQYTGSYIGQTELALTRKSIGAFTVFSLKAL
ncbi:hypothetical protein DID78_06440, partial [Candidatus Marinamargulisbacteria bacterium SCGC AG-343-D04]